MLGRIISGLIVAALVALTAWWWKRHGPKSPWVLGGVVAGVVFGIAAVLASTSLSGGVRRVAWCLEPDSFTVVTGVYRAPLGRSAEGQAIEIKIFRAGATEPIDSAEIAIAERDGRFATRFPPPAPPREPLLINTAFTHRPGTGGKWTIRDFVQPFPAPCRQRT